MIKVIKWWNKKFPCRYKLLILIYFGEIFFVGFYPLKIDELIAAHLMPLRNHPWCHISLVLPNQSMLSGQALIGRRVPPELLHRPPLASRSRGSQRGMAGRPGMASRGGGHIVPVPASQRPVRPNRLARRKAPFVCGPRETDPMSFLSVEILNENVDRRLNGWGKNLKAYVLSPWEIPKWEDTIGYWNKCWIFSDRANMSATIGNVISTWLVLLSTRPIL